MGLNGGDSTCDLCHTHDETTLHAFWSYKGEKEVWAKVQQSQDISLKEPTSLEELIEEKSSKGQNKVEKKNLVCGGDCVFKQYMASQK